MKKVLLAVVALTLILTCCFTSVAFAETTADNYTQSFAYNFVKDFCEKFPTRKSGINVNDASQNDLQRYLTDCINNASDSKAKVEYQPFAVSEYSRGYNIVARLSKQGVDKRIVIGAHYDSDGQGANDNASGVAALLIVMNELSKDINKLPCNIDFVLFDGEELGLVGSYKYVSEMSAVDKENTLLMINMDSIANGDNLYVWCENKHTDLADLITGKSDAIREKPYAAGTYNLDNGLGYGYVEIPQNSDHTPFRLAGIPTALFFSGTYSADPWNYAESENPLKNSMNTSSDTFANLDKYNQAEFVVKIETTADVIVSTVLDGKFIQTATNQRDQLVNYDVLGNSWWARLICFAVLVIVVLVLVLAYYRKLQKNAILGKAEIKNSKVFTTPAAEDIFTFKDKKPKVEDVFDIDDKK